MGVIIYSTTQPELSLRRSYVQGIIVSSDYQTFPVLAGDTVSWISGAGYIYELQIAARFLPWSSNSYTWDYMMDAAGSSIDCVFFACLDGVVVSYDRFINGGQPGIKLHPQATGNTERFLPLPPAPPDYWLKFPPI